MNWGAGGTVIADNANALGTGTLTMFDGAVLQFNGTGYTLANAVDFAASGDPTIDTGAGTITMSGVITGPGALTKLGTAH